MLTQKIIKKEVTFEDIEKYTDLQETLQKAQAWAELDDPIFILGPTGSGKTCIAQAIHNEWVTSNSNRKKKFEELICTNIPEHLFESELFGHVKYAFTGALRDRTGLIEECNNGTIFLDEISEIPLATQAKLLRILDNRSFRKVGGSKEINSKVRIICAANRSIVELQNPAIFRQDLFYRLGMVITVPPICQRPNDFQVLKEALEKEAMEDMEKIFSGNEMPVWAEKNGSKWNITISPKVSEALRNYTWPGNIRELKYIFRGMLFAARKDNQIELRHLPNVFQTIIPSLTLAIPNAETLGEFENNARKVYVRKVLDESKTREEASKKMGISNSNLYKIIDAFKL